MINASPHRVRRVLRRLTKGKPVESVGLNLVHARVMDQPVVFCVNMERDPIQRNHRNGTFYEIKELNALRPIFPHGGVFVDIGANVGNHSLFAAQHLGASRVIPFEPNPLAYDLLIQNVLVNGLGDVIDLNYLGFGLSDVHAGGFAMEQRVRNLGGAKMLDGDGELEVFRADEILTDVTPDLIKIDVETMELRVLAGLSGILQRCRPILLVEVDIENDAEFTTWTDDAGYVVISSHQRYEANKNYILADAAVASALRDKLTAGGVN